MRDSIKQKERGRDGLHPSAETRKLETSCVYPLSSGYCLPGMDCIRERRFGLAVMQTPVTRSLLIAARALRDYNRNFAYCSAGLARTMGVCARPAARGISILQQIPVDANARSTVPPSSRGTRSRMTLTPYRQFGEAATAGPPISRHAIQARPILAGLAPMVLRKSRVQLCHSRPE